MCIELCREDFHNLCSGFEQVIHVLVWKGRFLFTGLDFRVADNADFTFAVTGDGDVIAFPKLKVVDFLGV